MENLQSLINGPVPLLIDCFATWCGPCRMVPPILKEVKEKLGDNIRIIKIDVDKNPQLSDQWQITSIPTLLLFREGRLLWRQTGVVPAYELLPILRRHLDA